MPSLNFWKNANSGENNMPNKTTAKPIAEKKNISLFKYTAHSNPTGVKLLLSQYGINPRSVEEAEMLLARIVRNEGDAGLNKIASIHPDKDLFVDEIYSLINQPQINADGSTPFFGENIKTETVFVLAGIIGLTMLTLILKN